MSEPAGRARPVTTVLDLLRARIDLDELDGAVLTLEAVAADLGYGDVRPLPGSIAWIDRLRAEGKRIALVALGERAGAALEIAGIDDRFDVVVTGSRFTEGLLSALGELGAEPRRVIVVGTDPAELRAARDCDVRYAIGVVRGSVAPEQLRKAGVDAVVADMQELLRLM